MCIGKGEKPTDTKPCLNHHLFQGPDLEVLSDVSTSGGVSVGNAECVCGVCVLYVCEEGLGPNVFANHLYISDLCISNCLNADYHIRTIKTVSGKFTSLFKRTNTSFVC